MAMSYRRRLHLLHRRGRGEPDGRGRGEADPELAEEQRLLLALEGGDVTMEATVVIPLRQLAEHLLERS